MKYISNAMKFGIQSRSSFLILNMIFWITEIKCMGRFGLKIVICSNFYEIWQLVQIEYVDYEYSTWNWLSWPKIIDSGKCGPNTEIYSDFYEIWHSQQIEHANYEYNFCQCLERWRDYWVRMILDSEWL